MIDNLVHNGIISPESAADFIRNSDKNGIKTVVLDATFVLPTSGENILENYRRERIPTARFFDIDAASDKDSHLPHMLPDIATFENVASGLGIGSDDLVLVYGQHGMIMGAARVWWMFRVFGHQNVLMIDGGLPAWKEANLSLESGAPQAAGKSDYKVRNFSKDMVVGLQDMIGISSSFTCPVLDARPPDRFQGKSPEPRPNMRSGHIPNSLNVPAGGLVTSSGRLKPKEELEKIFSAVGFDTEHMPERIIATCGSGMTACMIVLALFHLGYDKISVYDGSWSEWGHENSPTKVA